MPQSLPFVNGFSHGTVDAQLFGFFANCLASKSFGERVVERRATKGFFFVLEANTRLPFFLISPRFSGQLMEFAK